MRTYPVLRAISQSIYRAIGRSPRLTRAFLVGCGSVLRSVGPFPLRSKVERSLAHFQWPSVEFPRRTARVCDGVTVDLVPHFGEFDFRALLNKDLGYEAELFTAIRRRIDRYDAIVEIGANVGVYTLFFASQRRPGVPVFCFEPSAEAFRRLLVNLGPEVPPEVYPIPAAVAPTSGLVRFYEPAGHLTNGSLLESFAGRFSDDVRHRLVPSVDGGAVAALVAPHRSLLLKIDVEGAESTVILALADLIAAKRPEIVMEVLSPYVPELNALDVLRDHYRFFVVTAEGLEPRECFGEAGPYRDWYLLPRG